MRILVDENIPNITVHELRAMGHDVLDIRGTERQGMFDDELWPFAQTGRAEKCNACLRILVHLAATKPQFGLSKVPGTERRSRLID